MQNNCLYGFYMDKRYMGKNYSFRVLLGLPLMKILNKRGHGAVKSALVQHAVLRGNKIPRSIQEVVRGDTGCISMRGDGLA